MALEKITSVSGTAIHVPGADIDTDRIIPARFMKCVTFNGLGEFAFYDVRFDADGNKTDHPLNDPRFANAPILLGGSNFGCGSSREHAPQSLSKYGFRGLICESYAEIFFGNSTTLGIPCVIAPKEDLDLLKNAVESDPSLEVTIDVQNLRVKYADQEFVVTMAESAHEALVKGEWDPIQELIGNGASIEATAEKLGYV